MTGTVVRRGAAPGNGSPQATTQLSSTRTLETHLLYLCTSNKITPKELSIFTDDLS